MGSEELNRNFDLVSLFGLTAGLGLLHLLLPEAGEAQPEGKIAAELGSDVYGQDL